MTIPTASNYPESLDSDTNLYLVHDALRGTLVADYTPGDTSITVSGDIKVMEKFPPSGIITLTEQCSTILDVGEFERDLRAISLYYSSYVLGTTTASGERLATFSSLEALPGFPEVVKPKELTNVTLNVIASHHNNLKEALIAIEEFMGVKGTVDTLPRGDTITGRLNFLLKIMFTPKAWFKIIGATLGLTPLEITFQEQCFRLGPGDLTFVWDFGDGVSNICTEVVSITDPTLSVISVGPEVNVLSVLDFTNEYPSIAYLKKTIIKPYSSAGYYSPSLTVSNAYGTDTVSFPEVINPRVEAPEEAVIDIIPINQQFFVRSGEPVGGPYSVTPVLRAPTTNFISVEIPDSAVLGSDPLRSQAGEWLDPVTEAKYDPVVEYIWSMGDDLDHAKLNYTKGLYSIGGVYDLKVRVNTQNGAYRITTYEDALDIVEERNLWLWLFNSPTASACEFGLVSETFKTLPVTLSIERNDSFLEGSNNQDQAEREFNRNVSFSAKTLTNSGERGLAMLYWAQGGFNPAASQSIRVVEYEGFRDTYYTGEPSLDRYWNWLCLNSPTTSYFLFGSLPTGSILPDTNPSDQTKGVFDKADGTYNDSYTFDLSDYENGADELREHATSGYESGEPENGYFAVYRGCWKDSSGYFARNDGVDPFFKIKSFYRTEGIVGSEFQTIKKLPDMAGPTKLEGQFVSLTNGVFFFNNSGNVSAYNTTTGSWETGGPSLSSLSFRSVQDISVLGFDNQAHTLLAASDDDRAAYLSYDYSPNAFIKFNGQDITFTVITARPTGEQFTMGVY